MATSLSKPIAHDSDGNASIGAREIRDALEKYVNDYNAAVTQANEDNLCGEPRPLISLEDIEDRYEITKGIFIAANANADPSRENFPSPLPRSHSTYPKKQASEKWRDFYEHSTGAFFYDSDTSRNGILSHEEIKAEVFAHGLQIPVGKVGGTIELDIVF